MSDLDNLNDLDSFDTAADSATPVVAPGAAENAARLSRAERAAIILGVLGTESATPILEQMDDTCHRNFAHAMARLEKIDPETVETVIRDFVAELEVSDMTVSGGLDRAREMLQEVTDETILAEILDEADRPSPRNVWEKLGKVEDVVLAEMLEGEHPQTAAVILDRLPADKSAALLDRLPVEAACRIVLGMNRAAMLSPKVIDAIGQSVSKDFLAYQSRGKRITPADKIGAIMNYTSGDMRQQVLGFLGRTDPELTTEVRKKMFTFADIPHRIERRDVTAVVRACPNDILLPALAGAAENAPDTREFMLTNIASRVSEQIREELAELGQVKLRIAEEAQAQVIKTIRTLQVDGVVQLLEHEE